MLQNAIRLNCVGPRRAETSHRQKGSELMTFKELYTTMILSEKPDEEKIQLVLNRILVNLKKNKKFSKKIENRR